MSVFNRITLEDRTFSSFNAEYLTTILCTDFGSFGRPGKPFGPKPRRPGRPFPFKPSRPGPKPFGPKKPFRGLKLVSRAQLLLGYLFVSAFLSHKDRDPNTKITLPFSCQQAGDNVEHEGEIEAVQDDGFTSRQLLDGKALHCSCPSPSVSTASTLVRGIKNFDIPYMKTIEESPFDTTSFTVLRHCLDSLELLYNAVFLAL